MGKRGPKPGSPSAAKCGKTAHLTDDQWNMAQQLASAHCSFQEIIGFLKCKQIPFERAIRQKYGLEPEEWLTQFKAHGKAALRLRAYNIAMEGKQPSILWAWLANHLGFQDVKQVVKQQLPDPNQAKTLAVINKLIDKIAITNKTNQPNIHTNIPQDNNITDATYTDIQDTNNTNNDKQLAYQVHSNSETQENAAHEQEQGQGGSSEQGQIDRKKLPISGKMPE